VNELVIAAISSHLFIYVDIRLEPSIACVGCLEFYVGIVFHSQFAEGFCRFLASRKVSNIYFIIQKFLLIDATF
jgi:hypothetical protein